MIGATLDAKVLVSGFPASRGVPAEILERWVAGEFRLILSDHMLDGVARAWVDAYYAARFAAQEAQLALHVLRTQAQLVIPSAAVRGVATNEEDDLVLATAVAGQADYLVTGNRKMREFGAFQGIAIVSPREFFTLLRRGQDGSP